MCKSLPCRPSDSSTNCVFTNGVGAAVGTTCDSGKVTGEIKFFNKSK
jgi:hypothetical protein